MIRIIALVVFFAIIAACLAVVIVPRFLDRVYYRGPVSDHFDGERFFNPGEAGQFEPPMPARSRAGRVAFMVRYLLGRDGRPEWPDHVDVAQAKPPATVAGDEMLVTWVGHASVLVQTQGLNILTDPVWSEKAGPLGLGPTRVAQPGIAFDDLPKIDLVLISHNHYDHLDLATLKRLWNRDHPLIVTSLGNDSVIAQSGAKAVARDWGGTVSVKRGIDVVVTRGHHWTSRWFSDRNRALWSGFVVRLPGGNLYFAGDTGFGDGKWPGEAAAYGPIRLALIPIGAFRFVEGQMESGSHVGPLDAMRIFQRLHAAHAIGIHWGTFRLSREGYLTPPRLLNAVSQCAGTGDAFTTIPIGESVEIPLGDAPPQASPANREELLHCLDTPAIKALR
ncbi:MBL fold metallo-hydrolase [Stakelama sp. CBK3Z-3]|uniref:MBL fold metallo-hydrolase n=1 Tax=Stakelama flava TaxID=2860338 RepID=A0ABS6XLS6_9SPHN|nr:MBL fold metallo-hydrolase [Stakelama flava]MBW4331152.1 MBL fold metallo-hydrolase [Stakelama flava]